MNAKFTAVVKSSLDDEKKSWTFNLKDAPGSVKDGEDTNVDFTIFIEDNDVIALVQRKITPWNLFKTGRLKIKGKVELAMRLTADIIPADIDFTTKSGFSAKQEEYMREAIRLSERNVKENTGGPFGCVVVKDGVIIA